MQGLQVYKDLNAPVGAATDLNFYSRRSGGPYYRWRYEKVCSRWQWARMGAHELEKTALVAAHWNAVPADLKLSLDEHYQE
ncbi:MAG TPA: hypothetical protein VF251_02215 [Pyrinomonadaceae bacterium]